MKKLLLPFFLFITLTFVSCIDYYEKMKLNDNGSGEVVFGVGLNEDLVNLDSDQTDDNFNEERIRKNYENKDGIQVVGSRTYSKDGIKWIEIALKFDSLEKLEEVNIDSVSNGMMGKFSLSVNENGNWVFTRKIFNSKNEYKDSSETGTNAITNLLFNKYVWNYELTLPSKIINTNAKEEDVDTDKNTVKWSYNFADISSPREMTVTFEKRKSTSIYYVVAGALLLVFLSIAALKLTKKKKSDLA